MKTPSSPEEYREQAERARRLADVVPSEEMRQRLLEVARGYQEVAASSEAVPGDRELYAHGQTRAHGLHPFARWGCPDAFFAPSARAGAHARGHKGRVEGQGIPPTVRARRKAAVGIDGTSSTAPAYRAPPGWDAPHA